MRPLHGTKKSTHKARGDKKDNRRPDSHPALLKRVLALEVRILQLEDWVKNYDLTHEPPSF